MVSSGAATAGGETIAILLGVAQDGGVPQAGCRCRTCAAARHDPELRRRVVSLGVIDAADGRAWMIDATPDFGEQLAMLEAVAPGCRLSGLLLTHAHMGHYLGLAHLGREAMASHRLGVYATVTMAGFLRGNAPWSLLIEHGHIVLHAVRPGVSFPLGDQLEVEAITVPHRDELSDTVAYRIQGPERSLLYCPDIDSWSAWGDRLPTLLDEVDIALLDATFYSRNELPGRDLSAIAHPLVVDTVPRVEGARAEVVLVHLNHTNPLLVEGPERSWIAARGVHVGREGAAWSLG